ncbi:hypothetical protein BOTBODRAFT_30983 [Botryobasidium botryosum FD-172 SS1]|uniref:Rhodanese domain-containing protein n=1 Tax=Botryobasidium botryosum (strain FD-172 SS1) TaxID=930990 RepID=A0A067MKI9_BOTB1|nr:hypothetical protein BOTBODRAFT_30983 [Botryobasidium botryosum FD-172 SS1]
MKLPLYSATRTAVCRNGARNLPLKRTLATAAIRGNLPFEYDPEVLDALKTGKPVVALESTIITHGMPYRVNLDTSISVENIVRSTGAVPATIALLSGRIHVGLSRPQLERIADTENNKGLVKLSRRDLAPAIAAKRDGGTTIAGTMVLAELAGIKVFATGGLGGVHRGGETSMDVSADLTELGRTNVAVVTSGVKSILDIGRTLEYLETQGAAVVSYGKTDDFPAFYSPKSGFKSPWRVNSPHEAAYILHASHLLRLQSGTLIAVPIPEQYAASGAKIQEAVEQALLEDMPGVTGRDVTPAVLRRVVELTGGLALENNIALIENTALVGGQIAVEYAKMIKEEREGNQGSSDKSYKSAAITESYAKSSVKHSVEAISDQPISEHPPPTKVLIAGATAVDIISQASPTRSGDKSLIAASTVPGKVSLALGGVARNVAEAAHRLLPHPHMALLVSPVGDDAFAELVRSKTQGIGMRADGFVSGPEEAAGDGSVVVRSTPVCNMVLDGSGELVGGVADFSAVEEMGAEEVIEVIRKTTPQLVAFDGNLSPATICSITEYCRANGIQTWFEPTSVVKSTRIISALSTALKPTSTSTSDGSALRAPFTYISPNILELRQIFAEARDGPSELMQTDRWWHTIDSLGLGSLHSDLSNLARVNKDLKFLVEDGVAQMAVQMLPFFQHLIVKCGGNGVFVVMHLDAEEARKSGWYTAKSSLAERLLVVKSVAGDVIILKHFPAHKIEQVVNVTGAGDSLVGSLLASLVSVETMGPFHDPVELQRAVGRAQSAAIMSLQSPLAVSPLVSTLKDSPK